MTQRDDRHPTINTEAWLYVFPCGGGYSCLGFDVAERRLRAMATWLGKPALVPDAEPGSPEHLAAYLACTEAGHAHHATTGARTPGPVPIRDAVAGDARTMNTPPLPRLFVDAGAARNLSNATGRDGRRINKPSCCSVIMQACRHPDIRQLSTAPAVVSGTSM